MNFKEEKVSQYISLLLDDPNRPCAVFGLDGTILKKNESFREKLGSEHTKAIHDFVDEDSLHTWKNFSTQVSQSEQTTVNMCVQLASKKKTIVKVNLLYFNVGRKIVAVFNLPASSNGTAGKAYVKAFRHSESFMAVIDNKGIIHDVNEMHSEFFNLPRSYFVGRKAHVLTQLLNVEAGDFINYYKKIQEYGYAEVFKRVELSPNEVKQFYITTFFDEETEMYLFRIKDRTEKMFLEERLAHKASLSTVGELAASIAHEIRNPMTTLKGFTQLLRGSATDESIRYITVIEDEIERMDSILNEMLILSKPTHSKKSVFSLEALVRDMASVLYPKAMMEGIKIVQNDNGLKNTLISGSSDKIKQVLLNLFKNALESMESGGTLTIDINQNDAKQLVVSITDTGKGMNLQQVNQIFMPFFSSKREGTGLGLPFVLKTIEEHKGTITVESEVGVGTTFTVTLPKLIETTEALKINADKLLLG
ncbi:ATP-binding protein [Filibacter tadaridae]|uniref:histidine kinase n=1 Tax=Filibacter tadaridae TaxID=2483811 RepID=A0A3P5X6J2_9BACL|nr:ATP-binding protein [Filibacter tadaridae]VDC29929.1 Sporulation kinase E [Filibacter tadaridae]